MMDGEFDTGSSDRSACVALHTFFVLILVVLLPLCVLRLFISRHHKGALQLVTVV